MRLGAVLLDLFFPPHCAFCARGGISGICPKCRARLPKREKPLCKGAGYGKCAIPLYYEDFVRSGVIRYKFSGARSASEAYGKLLAECVAEELSGEFDLITWVPISRRRRRERGYDQGELLAREMASVWQEEPIALLHKKRNNPPQARSRDAAFRRANVLGVYEAIKTDMIKDGRILLVDDILTTGATMAECARVLKDAGAKQIVCAALATPRD